MASSVTSLMLHPPLPLLQHAYNLYLMCYMQKRELLDLATVSDQEIKNDDVVYMVFTKETGGGWEELHVDTLVAFGEESEGGV